MDVIAVCDVVTVRNTLDDTKSFLQALGELVCCGFHWCAIDREVDICFHLPLRTCIIQMLHDRKTELFTIC